MFKNIPPLQKRLLFLFLVILTGFLALSTLLIVSQQHQLLLTEETKRAELEIDLISGFIKESFLQQDYVTVSQFLLEWCQHRHYILNMQALGKNDFKLVDYAKDVKSKETLAISRHISFSPRNHLQLSIIYDLSHIHGITHQLTFQLMVISTLLISLLGLILAFTLFKIALLPMENEIKKRTLELQLANESLQKQRDFVTVILDTISALVIVLDPQTKVQRFNRAATDVTGYASEQVEQRSFNDFFPEMEFERMRTLLRQLQHSRPRHGCETVITTCQGTHKHIVWNCATLHDDQSRNISHYVVTGVDITERKHIELALQQAKEHAEQAKLDAELANRAKGTFLANMSHELRTPLNGILGYAQILDRDRQLTDKQREGVQVIHKSGEYLLTLVNDILDISKIEAEHMKLYLTDFNFNEFVREIIQLFQIRTAQKKLSFIYEPISPLPLGIRADETRLRQILINLLSNAVKFTESGGIALKIGVVDSPNSDPGQTYPYRTLRFQIEDTGIGIAEEEIEKIFIPFQQVGDPKYRPEGAGLGLSITKKLVQMMGGELQVKSNLGQGATFWTELRFQEVSGLIKSTRDIPPIIVGFQFTPSPYQEKECKVLIIDDKMENRSVLVNLLSPLGFQTLEASNGQEGLQKARQWNPDLILTDLVMPIMDGFEVTRQLRRIPKFEDTVIIANSASVFEHDQQSLEAGCNAFISKPIRADHLLDLIQVHLGLTWIYEHLNFPTAEQRELELIAPLNFEVSLTGPSKEQANLLFDLAMMGDLMEISKKTEEFAKENGELTSFAEKVRKLAKSFDEKGICDLLENYL